MATNLGRPTSTQIGLTYDAMADVKVEPFVEFMTGSNPERTVCGGSRWQGSPKCRWTFPGRLLTGEEMYQYTSLWGDNPSVAVYITTSTQRIDPTTYQPAYTTYSAILHKPEEDLMMRRYYQWEVPDEGLLFTNLTGIT